MKCIQTNNKMCIFFQISKSDDMKNYCILLLLKMNIYLLCICVCEPKIVSKREFKYQNMNKVFSYSTTTTQQKLLWLIFVLLFLEYEFQKINLYTRIMLRILVSKDRDELRWVRRINIEFLENLLWLIFIFKLTLEEVGL